MSTIDAYKHELLGMVRCPSSHELVYMNWDGKSEQFIPLYRLLEDIPKDETEFQGNKDDLILGGGGGEVPAIVISLKDQTMKPFFWSLNTAYYICEGFTKVGWDGKESIEIWLMEHIVTFLENKDSSVIRKPTPEQQQ